MRFLFIAPRLHSNLYFSFKGLLAAGHKVSLLTLYRGKLGGYYDLVQPGALGYSPFFTWWQRCFGSRHSTYLKTNFELKYAWPPLWRFYRELRRAKPEVVVIKNIASVFSLVAAVLAKLLGAKIIFTLQIDKYRSQKRSRSVFWVGKIFGAHVITPLLGDPAKFGNDNANLYYLPFVIEPIAHARQYFWDDFINIMAVGKFVPRKNHLLLLAAFQQISHLPVRLTIVGERADEHQVQLVHDYIKKERLDTQVNLRFDLSFQETLVEYTRHDLFVLASSDEAAAVSPLEAMSRGLAVISSSANGTRCYIEEGKNGFVFRDKDKTDLVAKLKRLIADKDQLKATGQYGLELVKTLYRPEGFVAGLMKLIKN